LREIHIRRMMECDLESVSDISISANPHAVKERYCVNLVGRLNESGELSFVARKMVSRRVWYGRDP